MDEYNTTDKSATDLQKPSIHHIVSQYIALRKAGKEFVGLCPFHSETNPSFCVNEDKALFYCFGCGVGGDVIRFVQLIERLSFRETLKQLGLENYQPAPRRHLRKAREVAAWATDVSEALSDALYNISREIRMTEIASQLGLEVSEYRAELDREFILLSDAQDDLFNAEFLVNDFWKDRQLVEDFISGL